MEYLGLSNSSPGGKNSTQDQNTNSGAPVGAALPLNVLWAAQNMLETKLWNLTLAQPFSVLAAVSCLTVFSKIEGREPGPESLQAYRIPSIASGSPDQTVNSTSSGAKTTAQEFPRTTSLSPMVIAAVDVNERDGDGYTPLMRAVLRADQTLATALIRQGADLEVMRREQTALALAVKLKQTNIVEILLRAGANVEARTLKPHDKRAIEVETPLYIACYNADPTIAQMLISKGADVNAQVEHARNGKNPLAAGKHSQAIMVLLLKRGAFPSFWPKQGDSVSISTPDYNPLVWACERRYEEAGILLAKNKLLVSPNGAILSRQAVSAAISSICPNILREIRNQGVGISSRGALVDAVAAPARLGGQKSAQIEADQLLIIDLLLKDGADINAVFGSYNALHQAAVLNDVGVVEFLLKKGAKVDLPNNEGHTPLMLVGLSKEAGIAAMKILVQAGADVNHQDKNGDTIMHKMGDHDDTRGSALELRNALVYLLNRGANPHIKNGRGETALDYLDRRRRYALAKEIRGLIKK